MTEITDLAPVIAIDGPSGSGKGAITHMLADKLGFHILDSGALYRLIGLSARRKSVPFDAEPELAKLASEMKIECKTSDDPEEPIRIHLDGEDAGSLEDPHAIVVHEREHGSGEAACNAAVPAVEIQPCVERLAGCPC